MFAVWRGGGGMNKITKKELEQILNNRLDYLRSGNKLNSADLIDADLRGANLDYSSFPLWCGGLYIHLDDRQVIQLLFHTVQNALFSKNTSEDIKRVLSNKELIKLANKIHRIDINRITPFGVEVAV